MSSRAVRLPIVGGSLIARAEAIPAIDEALRAPFVRPTFVHVAASPRALEAAITSMREAARASGRALFELHAEVSRSPGRVTREGDAIGVEGPLLELPALLLEAERAMTRADLVIATGAALVALRRARVAILVTDGRTPGDWPADVRSVRDRIDLVVPELDPILARELIARL